MAAPGVVPTLNPGEDSHAGLRLGLEAVALDELGLQAGEEALGHRVVVGIAHGAHRGANAHLPAALAEGKADGRAAARELIRLVENRNATLLTVGQEILSRQEAALNEGSGALVPMTMAEVAAAVGLHESTISRVVAGTAVDTPGGTWWLRALFTGAVREGGPAAGALRDRLARLIAAEDPAAPLSDEDLARALATDGAPIARRTVAKYRAVLNLPPAHRRRLRQ